MSAPAPGPLTKVSANFTERSLIALEAAAQLSGDNEADCLNRAIQVYALVVKTIAGGGHVRCVDAAGVPEVLELS